MNNTKCKFSLRAIRINAGYTLEQWSKKLNVSAATISRWEHGLNKIPRKKVEKICELGGVTESMLSINNEQIRKEKNQ